MTSTSLSLYKNDKSSSSPIDTIQLQNRIRSIQEQAEDIMGIPHSFKIIFRDQDEESMLFYCDEEVSLKFKLWFIS